MFESLGLEVWHLWLIAASLIAVIELLVLSSYYLLAVAGGAAIVGFIAILLQPSLTMQWFLFACATAVVAVVLRSFQSPIEKDIPDDISYMVVKQVEVLERVSPRGRVMYKAVSWAAESSVIVEVGEAAIIERVNGSTLFIKKLESDKGEV